MCGIAGLIDLSARMAGPDLQAIVTRMNDAIVHRGPDSSGVFTAAEAGVALAHRRLAIVDLSPEGHQPMLSNSGNIITVFNGEIYNFLELRQDLERAGHVFRGRSDTEVLLAAIESWGLNRTCQKINGMFAIALFDRTQRTLHLIRDRMGKKPLYFGWAGNHLVFASELKALCAHPDFERRLNLQALDAFYTFGSIPAPHTIYKKTWTLPPGTRLTLALDRLAPDADISKLIEPYWQAGSVVAQARIQGRVRTFNLPEAINACESLLMRCVADRMMSDVPLGAFLSGGIDSSLVVALMQAQTTQPVKTFNIGFAEAEFDESAQAQAVAQHLGTDHHTQIVTPKDARDVIPLLPDMYDEPFADVSQIPTYLVSAFARKHVTVALSGDGGDEMFGGYRRHGFMARFVPVILALPQPLRRAAAFVLTQNFWGQYGGPARAAQACKLADILASKTPLNVHAHFLSGFSARSPLLREQPQARFPLTDPASWPTGLTPAEISMFADLIHYLPNDILVKVDRVSMAVALEARAPLLDFRACAFAWELPLNYRLRHGQGKFLLREVLARHVPREIFERPKQGFAVPIADWLRSDLRAWAEDLLSVQALSEAGLYDVACIRGLWDAHIKGYRNCETQLWPILMTQSWMQRWKPSI